MVRRSSTVVKQFLAILSLCLTSCPLWAQQDDPALRDRLLKGVSQTARKVGNLSFRVKCVHSRHLSSVSAKLRTQYAQAKVDPDKLDVRKFECAVRGSYSLQTGLSNIGNEYFKVRNGVYAFAIDRSSGGARTSLQFVEQLGVNPLIDAQIAEIEDQQGFIALGALYVWSTPLSRLVESDSFKIKRVYAIQSGAAELVRAEFDHVVNDPKRQRDEHISDGFLICDPTKEWVLTEYGGTYHNHINNDESVHHVTLEFGESVGGIPMANKIVQTTSSLIDPGTTSLAVSTIEVTSHDVPEAEFFLSHYGLPEPNFRRGWFGAWVWYLLAGVGCLGVARTVMKRRRA